MRVSKTINLRKALQSELKKVHPSIYYENAPDTATYPYIVYDLEQVGEQYQLEMNVYDKGTSTAKVETLADAIESYFLRYIYRDELQIFTTYINTRNNVQEEDKTIKRRRLLFDLNYLWKEM